MEAIGFAKAISHHLLVKFIVIRGVSDLLDNKTITDGEGGQEIAVANVSAFVIELLYQLNYAKLNLPNIDINRILVQCSFER